MLTKENAQRLYFKAVASCVGLSFFAHSALSAEPNMSESSSATPGGGCSVDTQPAAQVTIQEFADFECSYCAKGNETVQQALHDFPGKIKVVFRNFPLKFHPHSVAAAKAMAAVCLQSPAIADQFQNELFTHQGQLISEGEPFLYATADKVGADVDKMKTDMGSQAVADSLAADQKLAEANGFQGTPSFIVGSMNVVGVRPYDQFKQIIQKQLGGP